ncbi:hypothetical protein [Dickeya sp. NCPPB 3274]|uniref:hypothetical protein n=1 Tax=Dickeya sp. NCPPB 3274 TaxID=568766 RepID=UPI0005B50D99|nr:hypothetical protein [Dickeya sp. NCPPB 3274]
MTVNMWLGLALILIGGFLFSIICLFVYSKDDTKGEMRSHSFRLDDDDEVRWLKEKVQITDMKSIPAHKITGENNEDMPPPQLLKGNNNEGGDDIYATAK